MLDGMFTTWDSTTHRLKTTNIIPSNRKLFFNTNTNSLGFANHTYDSSYSAESFTFTTSNGNLFFNAGTSNLNIDTDKTYFRFYKNLFIPSSIISSGTSISLLNASETTIATFGSPSTINSSLNVANQVIIKGGSDTKLIMQSTDADDHNLIESQNSSGTVLSKLGYYGTFWGIDNKKIATEEFANNKFLPLAGGTMTGVILMNNNVIIQSKNSSGTAKRLIGKGSNNVTYIGDTDGHMYLYSDATDIIHVRNGTNYTIYDSYNFNPGNYLPLAGGNMSGNILFNNNINLQWKLANGDNATQMYLSANNVLIVGNGSNTSLYLRTPASDIQHDRGGTNYRIWDAANLTSPLLYASGTAATPTTIYNRNLGVNGSQWTFLSATNATTTSIYAPTTTGTSGQVLTSTGGVPTWNSLASIGDSRYVKKNGDTMTGNLSLPYLTSTQPVSGWTSKKVPNDYKPKSFYLEDDYNGGSGISNYGTVVTFSGRNAHWVSQMRFAGGDSTRLAVRTCNYVDESETLREFTDWEILANQEYVNSKVKNYLPLSGGTMSGNISFNGNTGHIVVGARETSNFVKAVSFTKGSATNSAYIGYHSTGGSDSSGALILVPYSTSANPWNKTVGLYIAKNELLLDGNAVATQTWVSSQGFLKTAPSISITTSGSGNVVTGISASGHTLTVTKGATYLTSSSLSGYATQSWVTSQGYLTSSSLSGYATQTWVNNKNYAVRESDNVLISHSNEFNFTASSNTSIVINYRGGSGSYTSAAITEYRFYNGQGSYSNVNILANSFTGSLIGNASSATKLGSSTVGGTAKPIYLSSGTATACSATVGSSTVPVYMSAGTITQCSTTLGVSITGNAATATTATNSNNLGGYAAATYVKSTSTTKVQDIQVVTAEGSTTGVLYVVLES